MKKFLLFLILIITFIQTVNASTTEYSNSKGVQMTKIEKECVEKLYGKDYVNIISQEEFDTYKKYLQNIDMIQTVDTITPRGINDKRMSISKSKVGNNTLVNVRLQWLQVPYIKSYDVMGARLNGVTLIKNPTTYISDSSVARKISTINKNNGFGTIIQLIGNGMPTISQNIEVAGSGIVYASYQHSNTNISIQDAQSFSISSGGLGSVFNFSKNYAFDGMNGLSISI